MWPESYAEAPLKGLRMVEVFSGVPEEGGAMLSAAWEAAGGIAVRYDNRYDDRHDFVNDDGFWTGEYEKPADMYHFAFRCHHTSMARATPSKPRHMDRPYGDEGDMETAYYNTLARLTGMRILALAARGAAILVEQPLLSYLLLQTGFLGICGAPGFVLFRADDCTAAGTPYQKARAWITSRYRQLLRNWRADALTQLRMRTDWWAGRQRNLLRTISGL